MTEEVECQKGENRVPDFEDVEKKRSFPMRETKFPLLNQEVSFNAVTSFIGFFALWGIAIYCMVSPDEAKAKLGDWKTEVSLNFTWFYILANPVLTFFVVFVAFKYGDVKLGKKDSKPEFSDMTYFAMLFSAGVAVGLFFYGVSEPLWHQNSHWFANPGYRSQDEVDQFAMLITIYHWGFAGWSLYLVCAICAGIAAYRFDLPMTIRSTLYVIFGEYTWGWIGDVVDGFSIITIVSGVCTSLGLGAMQVVTGAQRLGWTDDDLDEDELTQKQVIVIWCVTAVATTSVVSGLNIGIKYISQIGFGLGMVLLFACFAMENTKYLLNLMVQTTGQYLQWAPFQLAFWTDAFGQLKSGEGRAVDGGAAASWWMDAWTVFYMAWWAAWTPFVGLFIARISKGRSIREVVTYAFIAPMIYSILWFCTFGGIGLRQQRQALEMQAMGEALFEDSDYYQVAGSKFCYDVPQQDVYNGTELYFTNTLKGITPVCAFDTDDGTNAWFNVLFSFSYPEDGFGGFGKFLSGLSLVAVTLYFVTSSDSGSLVVDHLASNGKEEHHFAQRIFWAITEGAFATALLVAGGSDALNALQAASIVFGLPFNVFLFAMCYSMFKMCEFAKTQDALEDGNDDDLPEPDADSFSTPLFGGIFNIFEYIFSLGMVHPERVEKGMHFPTKDQTVEFFKGLFTPFLSLYQVYTKLGYDPKWTIGLTGVYTLAHFTWVVFFILGYKNVGFVVLGWTFFFVNTCFQMNARSAVREKYGLAGNAFSDMIASTFLYPQGFCQMVLQFNEDIKETELAVGEAVDVNSA
mmetsp:Transcript_26375/g.37012  ORF Transcript_26375/g.37012 Transcript_26375/m.37012 type:complete len:800 (-) Transcript_26375:209-2608(-)